MTPRRLIALFLLLVLAAAPPAEARRRSVGRGPDVRTLSPEQWLRMSARSFATVEPRSGFADLEFLRPLAGDARLVSLGEATHGTREFFKMKHRVLEYLVENLGFTVFAIEAALPEADAVNDYVLHGTGDPAAALAGMHYWTWNTREVLDLIEWMRAYNQRRGPRPPVQFRGFDVQYSRGAIDRISAYLDRVDPAAKAQLAALWQCWEPYALGASGYVSRPEEEKSACRASLASVRTTLESKRDQYAARSSAAELEVILRYATVMSQDESLATGTGLGRDALMAENVEWLANVAEPDAKIVLWAHNLHVATSSPERMGWHLRRAFGSEMVVFGFAFDHGSFIAGGAPGLGPKHVDSPRGGIEDLLRTAGPLFIVDLRQVPSDPAREYLAPPLAHWSIGELYNGSTTTNRWPVPLRDTYDALIWIAESTESRLLGF